MVITNEVEPQLRDWTVLPSIVSSRLEVSGPNQCDASGNPNDGLVDRILKSSIASTKLVLRVVFIVGTVFLIIIPIGLIYIGSVGYTKCPFSIFIPIYLIVSGSFGVIMQLYKFYLVNRTKEIEMEELRLPIYIFITFCIWCIIGGLCITFMKPPNFFITDFYYCDEDLYKFTLITIKLGVIYLVLVPCSMVIFVAPRFVCYTL